MTGPDESQEHARLDERAERLRERFRSNPAFLDMVRRSQEDERAGRYVDQEEIQRKYEIA